MEIRVELIGSVIIEVGEEFVNHPLCSAGAAVDLFQVMQSLYCGLKGGPLRRDESLSNQLVDFFANLPPQIRASHPSPLGLEL